MAFSVSFAIYLFILLVITCSCVLAGTKFSAKGYANPYVLVRLKRSPHRAFTYSGFDPTNGMAAFATSADFIPYYQYPPSVSQLTYSPVESRGETFMPSPNTLNTDYKALSVEYKPASDDYKAPSVDYTPPNSDYKAPSAEYEAPKDELKPPSFDYKAPNSELVPTSEYTAAIPSDNERTFPAQNLTPPSEFAPSGSFDASPAPVAAKKPKKKPAYAAPVTADDGDDEDEAGPGKSRSSSSASFNAWFPIVLGMYPSQQGRGILGDSYKEKDAGSVSAPVREREPASGLGTTVIANSVSHGKSSVASSHAIAYGGDAPLQSYRKG